MKNIFIDKRKILIISIPLLVFVLAIISWNLLVHHGNKNIVEYENRRKNHLYKSMTSDIYDNKKCYNGLIGEINFLGYENGAIAVSAKISNISDSYICVNYNKLFATEVAFVMTDSGNHILPTFFKYDEKEVGMCIVIPPRFSFIKTYNICLSNWYFVDPEYTHYFVPGIYKLRMQFINTNSISFDIDSNWYKKTKKIQDSYGW